MDWGLSYLQLSFGVLEDLGQVLVCLHFVFGPAKGTGDAAMIRVFRTAEIGDWKDPIRREGSMNRRILEKF